MVKITPGRFEYYANVVGINLGSTNSYLSVLGFNGDKHTPIVINKFPSVVQLKSGSNPGNTVYDLMRLIGRSFDDPIVQKDIKRNELCGIPWPYKIVRSPPNVAYGNKDLAWVKTSYGHLCSPVSMLQSFLANMKQTAESYIGKENVVNGAMFAFPRAKIPSSVIKAIYEAAYKAGLVNNGVIFQSTAAAITYGLHNKEECRFFAVVDLGARTFNVSIIERVDTKPCFKTKGYAMGDLFLGGEDFDNILMEYLVSEAKKGNGFTTTKDIPLLALQKFRRLAELVKIELSCVSEIKITLPPITSTDDASRGIEKHTCIKLTRSKFEGLASNLIERIKGECLSCLEEACITARDVDEVVLVGGMARVPMVERVVKEVFGKTPCRGSIAPDEAVALGAISAAFHDNCMGIHDDDLWTLFDEVVPNVDEPFAVRFQSNTLKLGSGCWPPISLHILVLLRFRKKKKDPDNLATPWKDG